MITSYTHGMLSIETAKRYGENRYRVRVGVEKHTLCTNTAMRFLTAVLENANESNPELKLIRIARNETEFFEVDVEATNPTAAKEAVTEFLRKLNQASGSRDVDFIDRCSGRKPEPVFSAADLTADPGEVRLGEVASSRRM